MKTYLIALMLSMTSTLAFADEPPIPGCGAQIEARYKNVQTQIETLEKNANQFVPPAPPTYDLFCRGEADYAERDQLQDQNKATYVNHYLNDITQVTRELLNVGKRLEICGQLDDANFKSFLERTHQLALNAMKKTIDYFNRQPGRGKYDSYMPVIHALINLAKMGELTGGDTQAILEAVSRMTMDLTTEMIRRLRADHDYRYTAQSLIGLVKKAEALGALEPSQVSALIQKILKSFVFEINVLNVTKLDVDGARYHYKTQIQKQRVRYNGSAYLPSVFEIPYLEGKISSEAGSGALISPSAFSTEFSLELHPCVDEPRLDVTFDRFGAEEETFHLVDNEGNTADTTQPSPLDNMTVALLQMKNFIQKISGDEDENRSGWLFLHFPLRNMNPEIGDKIYQSSVPGTMSTRYTLEIVHTPE